MLTEAKTCCVNFRKKQRRLLPARHVPWTSGSW